MELGFILKKLIAVFIKPMSIALFLFIVGLFLLYKKKISLSKKILSFGLFVLLFFSYNPVANSLMNTLESQYPKLEKVPEGTQYILLLGGDFEKRGWELLRLYHQNTDLTIITSGYEGNRDIPEAIRSAKTLMDLGIDKESIVIHSKPKDTKEEAMKIKEVLKDEAFILVTAAHHMPRAMALFKKEGTNPIAAPYLDGENKIDFFSIPSAGALLTSQIALHEYVGLLWAKLRGQI